VRIFVKDYYWNKDTLKVEFSDDLMKKKEQELRIKSEGDPSIF
jgi:hypothetical protein